MKREAVKRRHLNIRHRHILMGYVFISPFIIGLLAFFSFPMYISIKLSFGKVTRLKGFLIEWTGIENYVRAFFVDTQFIPMFLRVVRQTLYNVPLIIIFSLLLAIIINKSIRFKGFFRVVFFLPFLLGMGDVMRQLLNLQVDRQVISLSDGSLIPREFLSYLGANAVGAIDAFFGVIVLVLWNSGVQILLFLSGLQSIPSALYESAKVDGATEWEMFWKITLPMISPIMLLNIIYTLVDSFTNVSNPILSYIQSNAFRSTRFEYAAAMGLIYFLFIILTALAVMGIMNAYIRQTDDRRIIKNVPKTR
jgi:ABC-type sugar transport system permease subunit